MILQRTLATIFLFSLVGCKQGETSTQSSGASVSKSATELCGKIEKKGSDLVIVSSQSAARVIEPQDGATTNILTDAATRSEELCLRADWTGSGPVMIVSAAGIRKPVKKTIVSEECGVLMVSPAGKFMLQIAGNNSEKNVDRELEPQDGATTNLLKNYASTLTEICVKGDFSSSTSAVLVNSQAAVRKAK